MPDVHIQEYVISPRSQKEDYFGEIIQNSDDSKKEKERNTMKPIGVA
jgi:hypothetical protein